MGTLQVYDPDEVNRARLELLERTDMVDYTIDLYKNLLPSKLEEAKKGTCEGFSSTGVM